MVEPPPRAEVDLGWNALTGGTEEPAGRLVEQEMKERIVSAGDSSAQVGLNWFSRVGCRQVASLLEQLLVKLHRHPFAARGGSSSSS